MFKIRRLFDFVLYTWLETKFIWSSLFVDMFAYSFETTQLTTHLIKLNSLSFLLRWNLHKPYPNVKRLAAFGEVGWLGG